MTCQEPWPFPANTDTPLPPPHPPMTWRDPAYGTGVVVSRAHVVTAAHVVRCPVIPGVVLVTRSGEELPAYVERDDAMFGPGDDLARVRLYGAYDRFDWPATPPALAVAQVGSRACAETRRGPSCGEVVALDVLRAPTRPGDSGAPVYDEDGRLVGIVTAGDGVGTQFQPLDVSWLSGT